MTHSLTERDVERRTATCSACDSQVKIQRSGNGWACGNRANAQSRKQKALNPDRDRTSKTEHTLTWQNVELRSGACAKCGPVEIVPVGRGWGCRKRQVELGRVNHQDKPATYCDACKILDGDTVWLTADGCPRCNETDLNAMFAQDEANRRLMGDLYEELTDNFMVVGANADPYDMPDYETAVPGWKTLG